MIKTLVRWISLAALVVGVAAADSLPAGWSSSDVGTITPAGTQSYSPATSGFNLAGAGADIWGTADQFHYSYQSWTGDGQWIVQVASLQNTNAWAKAGIMVRADITAGSANTLLALSPGNGVTFQRRKVAGGASIYNSIPGVIAPTWLKLVRRGNQFNTYTSSDGQTWSYWMTDFVTMPATVLVGLAVTSHHAGVLASASFTQFSANSSVTGSLPVNWSSSDVGAPSPGGDGAYTSAATRFDLIGSGADIWGTADQFQYSCEPWAGDGQWIVKLDTIQNTNVWAKAGLMVRENLAAGSRNTLLALTPGSGVTFQRRKATDGSTVNTTVAGATSPGWLKLVRKGNQFDSYTSSDGQVWAYWTTDIVAMPANVLVGLAVTSHHAGVLTGASFTHFDATVPLPANFLNNWTSQDIGLPALSGMADYDDADGLLTLRGAGTDIWGTADQCQFAYAGWTGNAVLVTRVESLQNTNSWAKAGVMIRASLDAGSAQAMVVLTPNNGVAFQRRTTTGGGSLNTAIADIAIPGWVKLERWGDRFDGYYSTDGLTWKYLGSQTIVMPAAVYIGLAVTSHNPNAFAKAEFSHLTYNITGAPGGLWGQYFSGKAFNTAVLQRLDDTVNFTWGAGSPSTVVPVNSFSARWTGWLVPDVTQSYTFYTVSDDGVRLWVNDQLLIDNWTNHSATTNSGTVTLNAGMAYSVKMEYFENTGSATAQLQWSAADRGKAAIPAPFLIPSQYPNLAGDGLPDYWKILHGLDLNTVINSTTIDPSTVDAQGNGGLTYLQEYGNSISPLITILGGDQQVAAPGFFNAAPLDVAVWKSDGSGPLVNTPVTFAVTSGGGLLAPTGATTSALSAAIVVNTDQDGTAQARYQQPSAGGVTSGITVSAGTASASFTTTSLMEPVPVDLSAQALSPTQILLSWSGDQAATSYTIERQTGDGDFESIAVVDNALSYIDSGLTAGETYTYRLKAQSQNVESAYTVPVPATTLTSGADFPVAHLLTWLKADAGVVTGNGTVSKWLDQSGQGNNATQSDTGGQPQAVAGQMNGQPVIRFDGDGKYLNLPDLMVGATEGEIFIVNRLKNFDHHYNGLCQFGTGDGVSYSEDDGDLIWEDFGMDTFDAIHGPGSAVLTAPNVYNASMTSVSVSTVRFNGASISTRTTGAVVFTATPLLGSDVFGEYFNGDIAEVIVFDHALNDAERSAVVAWLNARYSLIAPPPAPASVTAQALSPTQISLSWLGDTSSTYTVERAMGGGDYQVIGTTSNGPAYVDTGLAAGTDYTYRIKANRGGPDSAYSDPLTTTTLASGADFPVANLRLWLKADAGVVTAAAGVSQWLDQSGHGNDASQENTDSQPQVIAGQINGRPVIRFDDDGYLNLPDFMSSAPEGEIIAVVKVADKTPGLYSNDNNELWNFGRATGYYRDDVNSDEYFYYNGFGLDGSSDAGGFPASKVSDYHIFDTASSAASWTDRFNGVVYTTLTNQTVAFSSSPELGEGFVGDFAEVLVFDHTLSDADRAVVTAWLNARYAIIPPPAAPTNVKTQALSPTQVSLSWTGDAALTYTIERKAGDADYAVIGVANKGSAYIDTGLEAGVAYAYRIKVTANGLDSGYSEASVVNTPANGAGLPLNNLKLWLDADSETPASDQGVGLWVDQSGQGNHAYQTNPGKRPQVVAGALNNHAVMRFDGVDDQLNFPDLMSGASAGEIFIVARLKDASRPYNGLADFGDSGQGITYYAGGGDGIWNNFGNRDGGVMSGPGLSVLTSPHIFNSCMHADGTSVTIFNNTAVLQRAGRAVAFRQNPILGAQSLGQYFNGDIAAVLVFDRALDYAERLAVKEYLSAKYNLGISFAVTQPVAPASMTAGIVTANSVTLNWTPSTGASGMITYEVFSNGEKVATTTDTTGKISNLLASSAYNFTVRALDDGVVASGPQALSLSTYAPLQAPAGLVAPTVYSNSIWLNWTAAPGNTGVTGYNVYVDGALVGSTQTTSFDISNNDPASTHSYQVAAVDAEGNTSPLSAGIDITTPDGVGATGKPAWIYIRLPEGYLPVEYNMSDYTIKNAVTDSGIAFFSMNPASGGYQIYRWTGGNLDFLQRSKPGLGYSAAINDSGAIAIQGDGCIDFFPVTATTPQTISGKEIKGALLSGYFASSSVPNSRYYSIYWSNYTYNNNYLHGLDNQNRIYFDDIDSGDVGTAFTLNDNLVRYADFIATRSYSESQGGGKIVFDPAPVVAQWPGPSFTAGLWQYPDYAQGFFGRQIQRVSLDGHVISYDNVTGVYYVDARAVDYRPVFINKNGLILGVSSTSGAIIEYPDQSRRILPGSVSVTGRYGWIDDQDQPHGDDMFGGTFLERPVTVDGTVHYERIYDKLMPMPSGWSTAQKISFNCTTPQIGVMNNAATNKQYSFIAVPAEIAVDANRDGVIDLASQNNSDQTSADSSYRFWSNDDDDSGDTGGSDIPGQTSGANYSDNVVNGARDLVDFFPVFLDIKQLLTVLPPSGSIKYKIKQADGALNFVYTNQTKAHALDYQTQALTSGFGPAFAQAAGVATTEQITAAGVDLGEFGSAFLDGVKNNDWGVILVEGRATTTKPLVLSVEKTDGTVIAEVKLELSIDGVQKMYRHLNLREGDDAPKDSLIGNLPDTGQATYMGKSDGSGPDNFPDSVNHSQWFIFVVGSNVGGKNAQGWEAEIFKRMYWSQSKAKFVGVSWFGDPYADSDDFVYDYHMAVRNAFATAPVLADKINALSGSKTIASHSLGCGLVSSAIADHGLNVANSCMIDAALAMEAFKGDLPVDLANMAMTPWMDVEGSSTPAYNRRVWSAEWHTLFDAKDARSKLTWRDRFKDARTVTHNFYSSTENVLGKLVGTPPSGVISSLLTVGLSGRYAWVVQEKTKGQKLSLLFGHIHAGSDYGGWGFNTTDPVDPADPIYYTVRATPDTVNHGFNYTREPVAGAAFSNGWPANDVLFRIPVFDPGWGGLQAGPTRNVQAGTVRGPSWIKDLYGTAGSATAGDGTKRAQLLAEAFPALTLATGANSSSAFVTSKNHNLPVECVDNSRWPNARGLDLATNLPNWNHSDMREVAYFYTYKLFDQLKAISEPTP